MGKKNKSVKQKLYSIPRSKILVVLNPWGSPGHPTFANNVGGWFERMLQDEYPAKSINMIFTRPSDTVILVEMPEDIDVAPLLGAHHHCNFLVPPYNASSAVSYIYEYNYVKKGPPERQSCWKPDFPSYQSLGSNFPVKFPYPIPGPAPNPPDSLGNLAQPLPPHLLKRPDAPPPVFDPLPRDVPVTNTSPGPSSSRLQNSTPFPDDVKSIDTENTLYTSPLYSSKTRDQYQVKVKQEVERYPESSVVKKNDPYDDEEAASSLLRRRHNDNPNPVKNEPSVDHAEEFLNSIISVKKEEPISHPVPPVPPSRDLDRKSEIKLDDGYVPSSDLMSLFATLPPDLVSGVPATNTMLQKPTEAEDRANGYRPSKELSELFATLPAGFLNSSENEKNFKHEVIKTEESHVKIQVKPEPIDDDIYNGWNQEARFIERARSTTLATDDGSTELQSNLSQEIRVKAQPQDNSILFPRPTQDPRKRPESTHDRQDFSSNFAKTRDPRARPAPTTLKIKREAEPVEIGTGVNKRVKVESNVD